jgi:glycosyltransferase involved in cell wall biosynthesis
MATATLCGDADASSHEQARQTVRVLHLINGEHYSGAERVQDLLALSLPRFGYEAGFALLKPGRFAEARRSQGTPVFEAPMRSRWDVGIAKRIARLVADANYQIIHTHTPRAALVGRFAAIQAGVPYVHHVHSPTAADTTHPLRNFVNARLERFCVAPAKGIIAVSDSLGQYARNHRLGKGNIAVVPNGVPVWGPLNARSTPKGTWMIGCVALFRPRKGLEVLLHSLSELRAAGHSVRLLAVGGFETPEYEKNIHTIAAELAVSDLIEWTGFTTDVATQLARMDLFVLPSLFGEGLPMVLLEAMAAGVPVVSTRVEGIPQAVREGIDGVLAQPGSSHSLSAALGAVFEGKFNWQQLRESAHRRQADVFSDVAMARGVAKVYDEVLGR